MIPKFPEFKHIEIADKSLRFLDELAGEQYKNTIFGKNVVVDEYTDLTFLT